MSAKIDALVTKLVKENHIGKDSVIEAKTILTWLNQGRKEAEKISKKAVDNLVANGFVAKNGKQLSGDSDMGMWLILAILGAKGHIKRTQKSKS